MEVWQRHASLEEIQQRQGRAIKPGLVIFLTEKIHYITEIRGFGKGTDARKIFMAKPDGLAYTLYL
jgi:hypothetical protein